MPVPKILFATFFVATSLIFCEVAARGRYIPKPDSVFVFSNSEPVSDRRMMDGYTPHKSDHTIVLRGSALLGYYYATLFFGYPPQKETVIVDTGSSITAIPCKSCSGCGNSHLNQRFDPGKSRNYTGISCGQKIENFECKQCSSDNCRFYIGYTEGSMYEGIFASDIITASDEIESFFYGKSQKKTLDILYDVNHTHARGYFGCLSKEGGLFVTQQADGILGLGLSTDTYSQPPSFIDMLAKDRSEKYNHSFSICFANDGGYLTIGGQNDKFFDKNSPPIVVHYRNNGQYNIDLLKLSVKKMNGEEVSGKRDFDSSTGKFVDSGTTMLYLTSSIRSKLLNKMGVFCGSKGSNCGGNHRKDVGGDVCYDRKTDEWPDLNIFLRSFPNFTFTLENNQDYTLTGVEYLFPEQIGKEKYCLGIYELGNRIILGGIFMKNRDFHFDREKQMITITKSDCAGLMASAPSGKDLAIDWNVEVPLIRNDTNNNSANKSQQHNETKHTNDTSTKNNTNANNTNTTIPEKDTSPWTVFSKLLC